MTILKSITIYLILKEVVWFKQNLNITTQVLGSLTRVMQIHNRGNSSYEYFEEDSKYFRSKENSAKEEINYSTFRINTFLDEFYALQ